MSDIIPIEDHSPHLLVVDDDARIRTLMRRFLNAQGYRISTAAQAAETRDLLTLFVFDLIVLDVMMPGENGISLARALRGSMDTPVIMLTARGETHDRIAGLEAGADDYMAKPFEPRELLLRIKNLLRRSRAAGPGSPRAEVVFGPFRFNGRTGELYRGDEIIRITERERDILRILSDSPGEVVSRQALTAPAGAADSGASDRAVDVQINRLRRKIELDPTQPVLLQTVRGMGYKLMVEM